MVDALSLNRQYQIIDRNIVGNTGKNIQTVSNRAECNSTFFIPLLLSSHAVTAPEAYFTILAPYKCVYV